MKLRYYMRGLGIGMVVTALVMGIATRESLPLTDAEIKAKALTLGMVEEDSVRLSDIQPSPGQDIQEEDREEPKEDQSDTARDEEPGSQEGTSGTDGDIPGGTESVQESTSDGENVPEEDKSGDETSQNDGTGTGGADAGTITITVEDGAGSYKVCEQLEEAGLVEDAWEFDKYLIDNGCSKKVHAGTHRIPAGAGWEEIMKIITKTGN